MHLLEWMGLLFNIQLYTRNEVQLMVGLRWMGVYYSVFNLEFDTWYIIDTGGRGCLIFNINTCIKLPVPSPYKNI